MEDHAGDLSARVAALSRRVRSAQEALQQKYGEVRRQDAVERERLELVLESARLAWWDQDFVSGRIERSPLWAQMLGYQPGEISPTADGWYSLLHPEDEPAVREAARLHEDGTTPEFCVEHRMRSKSGEWHWVLNWGRIVARTVEGRPVRAVGTHLDITERKRVELEKEFLLSRLRQLISRIRPLRGIIPICAGCRRVRTPDEHWVALDVYLSLHADADFSHGLCPTCSERLYPDLFGDEARQP